MSIFNWFKSANSVDSIRVFVDVNIQLCIPVPERYKLKSDMETNIIKTGEINLKLVSLIGRGSDFITLQEYFKRAKERRCLFGQRTATAIFHIQDKIPTEWRGCDITFFGTTWMDSESIVVLCLRWCAPYGGGNKWAIDFSCLGHKNDLIQPNPVLAFI